MKISRRSFGRTLATLPIAASANLAWVAHASASELKALTSNAIPISADERRQRMRKAQRLMRERGIGALIIEPGSALTYFTGIKWWRSERFTGAIVLADDRFAIVTPYFEEPSIREQMTFGNDVRTWHENESPFEIIVDYLKSNNAHRKPVAVEETTRHFVVAELLEIDNDIELASGRSVTRPCRMFKSTAELALMQTANSITLAAYKHIYAKLAAGMTATDVSSLMDETTRALGGAPIFSMALFGEASAYPHGTENQSALSEGDIILMDCGCKVHDYASDISRTWVFGEPTKEHRRVWNTVKNGQLIALETAQLNVEAGRVDDAVRGYYESLGYGPQYKVPGLTHRVGHGIGMDIHEPINFVQGERTKIEQGMCFSNEPGIYKPRAFGVRLEDCLYIGDQGPVLFTPLSKSIDRPFG